MTWFFVSLRTVVPKRRSRRFFGARPLRNPGRVVWAMRVPSDCSIFSSITSAGTVIVIRFLAGPTSSTFTSYTPVSGVAVASAMAWVSSGLLGQKSGARSVIRTGEG